MAAAVVASAGVMTGAASAATYDLAFIMDFSGSISDSEYESAMDSLASALSSSIPTSGPDVYTISVVSFSSTATDPANVIVDEVVVDSAADLAAVVSAIDTAPTATDGRTCYECAFDLLGSIASASGDFSIINMMTDGDPNAIIGDAFASVATAQAAAITARDALKTAGWDSLSFEAVDLDLAAEGRLSDLAFDTAGMGAQPIFGDPSLISDPLNASFVLSVSDFGTAYDDAISAKVQKIVTPDPIPLPAGLPLIALGLGALGALRLRGRKKA
ncbi:DUF1194 domain-containing protein [Antarctobacter jejuensis]|uniref:DUF1194 domain-containing protein n=1 Tax=Antarctobacter jejuensis TaxID=1439938 RepID=UPI003FD581AF